MPEIKIDPNTGLQIITVKATLYMLPLDPINENELNHTLRQLLTPYVLIDDFNRHNTI